MARRKTGGATVEAVIDDREFPSRAMAVAFALHHVQPNKAMYVRDPLGKRLGYAEIVDGVRTYVGRSTEPR